jgi:hypothetical protein
MLMLDAHISEDAVTPEAERTRLGTGTDLPIEHEGADPTNEKIRSLAWVSVHRHETYVAGAPAEAPHHDFVCQAPEGEYDDERGVAVTTAMTDALVQAEQGRWPDPEARVSVCTFEAPRGTWAGLGGRVLSLSDITEFGSVKPVAETANASWPHGDSSRRTAHEKRPRSGSRHTVEVHE